MGATERAIAEIEDLAGQDIQERNIGPLVAHVRGNLAVAAASIARHPAPSVAIITGFFLADGEPPNCETDGPPARRCWRPASRPSASPAGSRPTW